MKAWMERAVAGEFDDATLVRTLREALRDPEQAIGLQADMTADEWQLLHDLRRDGHDEHELGDMWESFACQVVERHRDVNRMAAMERLIHQADDAIGAWKERVATLRALIEQAEWSDSDDMEKPACPWCDSSWRKYPGETNASAPPHAANCSAAEAMGWPTA